MFVVTAVACVGMALAAGWHLHWVQRLPPLEALADGSISASRGSTRCSVVVAARDEAARIEETVRRLLAQQGVEIEVIVVDDRSTDGTSNILRRLAGEDARLRVIRIDTLPEGWLGKCHACDAGARAATGEWILFTDADCWMKPDIISRSLRLAEREGVDHVTATSGVSSMDLGFRAGHLAFVLSISNWFSGVNRDRPRAYMGIGAFNLVRAGAYRECGGYGALRLTVLDDVKLGLLLRRAGKRTRAFLGGDEVECHWGHSIGSMIKVMEKNYFAILEFRLWLALVISGFMTFLFTMVGLGLFSHTAAGLAAVLSPLCLIGPAAILARRLGWTWRTAVGVPFVMPVFLCALLNSTIVTLRQGGVRWRDTFYSLDALRAGGVR
jgi:glycosyltransferase involved in cell wall biosynthesis